MKHSYTTNILILLFSVALFILGFFTFSSLFEVILPKIDGGFYQVTEHGELFRTSIIFSLVLGLTPFLIHITWRYSPILNKKRKIVCVLTVVISMLIAIIIRQQMLKSYFVSQTNNFPPNIEKLHLSYPMKDVNIEYYLLGGLISGCLISFLLLRQKRL